MVLEQSDLSILSLCVTILLALTDVVRSAGGDHYPDEKYNRKPCLRLQNTIRFQGPICQVTAGGYTDESRKNCEDTFRTFECPEMNLGTCETRNLTSPLTEDSKLGMVNIGMCRLYYKADGDTWAEIWYVNQYATTESDKPVWDIVEFQRNVYRTGAFGNRQLEAWPLSVSDSNGERGLMWLWPVPFVDVHTLNLDTATPICSQVENPGSVTDDRCSNVFKKYLLDNVIPNIGNITRNKPIQMSSFEIAHNANITYEINTQCMNVLILGSRVPACQAIVVRRARSIYSTNEGAGIVPVTKIHDSSFEILEYQIYNKPVENYNARYAFWSQEPTETRDEIFSNGA